MKRFLLADDNSDLRSALRLLLETRLNGPLVFEAADQAALIDQCIAQQPDCLILDWELPGFKDHNCLSGLRDLLPDLKIIITSARPESVAEALAAHADAFICKTDPPSEILKAIQWLNGKG
jgi:two-component system response regulator DesR